MDKLHVIRASCGGGRTRSVRSIFGDVRAAAKNVLNVLKLIRCCGGELCEAVNCNYESAAGKEYRI